MNKYANMILRLLPMLALLLALSPVAKAEAMPAPQALVKEASDAMLKALKDNKAELEQEPERIYGLVQDILMPHFDFARMARLALGRNWLDATQDQQMRFVEEFKLLLVRTYSTAMLEYTDEEIRFLPFRDDVSRKRVNVPMQVIQANGPSIPMTLSLYENDEGEWKVYDVKIEGISLVTNYRSTFANEIRNQGIDQLIENLAKRNDSARS